MQCLLLLNGDGGAAVLFAVADADRRVAALPQQQIWRRYGLVQGVR